MIKSFYFLMQQRPRRQLRKPGFGNKYNMYRKQANAAYVPRVPSMIHEFQLKAHMQQRLTSGRFVAQGGRYSLCPASLNEFS